jgi:hypothetical protein
MSTVDAVDICIDVHQVVHWWLPLFLTYPNFQTLSETSLENIIVQRHSPSLILGVGLRFSEHLIMAPTSSVAASTVVFSIRQPHWNIGTHISTIYIPRANRHREHPVQSSGQPRRSQRSRLGSTASRFSSNAREDESTIL